MKLILKGIKDTGNGEKKISFELNLLDWPASKICN